MKKILTCALAVILSVLMLCAIACSTASTPDTTYDGNYTSITAQDLYVASRNIKTNITLPSSENEKTGFQSRGEATTRIKTNEYELTDSIYLYATWVYTYVNGEIKNEANIKIIQTSDIVVGTQKSSSVITRMLYAKDGKYYKNEVYSSNLDGETNKFDSKYQISQFDFEDFYNQAYMSVECDTTIVPSDENGFEDFLNELTLSGLAVTAETENGLKVKLDIANVDLAKTYVCNKYEFSTDIFSVDLKDFNAYYIFNEDKTLKARKHNIYTRFISPAGNYGIDREFEMKAYSGSVSFPTNLNDYLEF